MPDTKISALPAAGAITGAELTILVQGGADVKAPLSALVGGSDQEVQFNDNGVFGGSSSFIFNKTFKQASLGNAASLGSAVTLSVSETGILNTWDGLRVDLFSAPAANNAGELRGISIFADNSGTHSLGKIFGAVLDVSGNASIELTGLRTVSDYRGAGTLPYLAGVNVSSLSTNAGDVTDAYGVHIRSAISYGGAYTTLYGLRVEDQTLGATNYAIHLGAGLYHFDGLTASQPVVTDASKNLVSLAGTTTTVTTASLVGKTMTFTNGILTGFA